MSARLVRGHEARGDLRLLYRLDLAQIDRPERVDAIARLVDQLDPDSSVEIVIADISEGSSAAAGHITELRAGGVNVTLVGPPEILNIWVEALRP